jgi:phosphatidylserine/phosphatidylglycerophosphate/cardiolipin synthase-like enzyme
MKALTTAVARLALELHPDRIETICSALSESDLNYIGKIKRSLGPTFSPRLIEDLAQALDEVSVSPNELCAMFRGASATASFAARDSVELVWSGPVTGLVPIRHTAQVLIGLIEGSRERLFLVSFVAYNVAGVIDALSRAIARGVRVQLLVERSKERGGQVAVDSVKMLRQMLPDGQFYEWNKTASQENITAAVHAKCAVSDGVTAFITSANLTQAAMERNMELGILIRGGTTPKRLENHLQALITTKQVVSC